MIAAWLEQHHPHVLQSFRAPATEQAIANAAMGLVLPSDYRRFLALHDGQEECSAMVWTCSLHRAAGTSSTSISIRAKAAPSAK